MAQTLTQDRPSAIQVAKYLIKLAHNEREELLSKGQTDLLRDQLTCDMTHLKLQKLVYFAEATHLAINDQELFEEPIEAWELGPVIRSVYEAFRDHGRHVIDPEHGSEDGIDEYTRHFLRQVWNEFGKYSATQLVELTHRHEPWRNAMKRTPKTLDKEEMRVFYKRMFSRPDVRAST